MNYLNTLDLKLRVQVDTKQVANMYLFFVFIIYNIIVMFSWVTGIGYPQLMSLFGGVTMKFPTALLFVATGISMFGGFKTKLISSVYILTTSIYIAISYALDKSISFIPDYEMNGSFEYLNTTPSSIALLLFCLYSFSKIFGLKQLWIVFIILPVLCILSLFLPVPVITEINDVGTSMSLPTSILFIHLGLFMQEQARKPKCI